MRIMLLIFACLLAAALAAPAIYDQRQDGELNARVDVSNILLVVAIPKREYPPSLSDIFSKHVKPNREVQERSDVHVMAAFVEPSEPYHVEIGESSRDAGGDGRAVEVVIAGRRRQDVDTEADEHTQTDKEGDQQQDEYKLIGATEQCGPDAERDPVTLACRARTDPPAVNPAPSQSQPEDQPTATLPTESLPEVVAASLS